MGPAAEGAASLLTAALALTVLPDGPAASLRPARRAAALGLAMAGLALLRTQLIVLWPLALWHVRTTLRRRQQAGALALAAALTVAVTRLVAVRAPDTGYLPSTAAAWQGGLSSPGADSLRGNLAEHVWDGTARLAISPLPYSGLVARTAGPLGMRVIAIGACLALVWVALRERRSGLPVLVGAPVALMVPFLAGFPYAMTPRFLVPAAPVLGYLVVAGLRRALGRAPRMALAGGATWLLLGVAWWAHLAPSYRARQQDVLADARRVVADLQRRGARWAPLCASTPEALWAVAADTRACRLVTTLEYLVRPARRDSAVQARLVRTGARCVVEFMPREAPGDARLPLAVWGYRAVLRTPNFSTWCRT